MREECPWNKLLLRENAGGKVFSNREGGGRPPPLLSRARFSQSRLGPGVSRNREYLANFRDVWTHTHTHKYIYIYMYIHIHGGGAGGEGGGGR